MSIKVENLTYTYSKGMPNETKALDDVSFTLQSGEFTAIIGHTGSGKSTLVQQLNGLLRPDSGSITVDDTVITDSGVKMVDIRRKVGLVFQYPEYQLFEETVAKDVAFGPKQIGITGDELERVVREAIELTGLEYETIRERSPFELSGGQRRRVAIAGVLAMQPSILILDEPVAGLDPLAHREILKLIQRIHREEKMTILLVSHNMGDIAELADHVLIMDHGKLYMEGTPREVFSQGEDLRSIGLGVPPAMEIMEKVKERIPEIHGSPMTISEAADQILQYIEENPEGSAR